jgi:hypothetical protein
MTSFEKQVAESLLALIRERMPSLAGFRMTAVSKADNRPALMVRMQKSDEGRLVIITINVLAEEYHELPAPGRNDVRTPGPMVPRLIYWNRPHKNALGEACYGIDNGNGECEEHDCPYCGEE